MAAVDLMDPNGVVVGASYGYDGSIDEEEVPSWQMYLGGVGVVRDVADWKVTAVANASAPTVAIAPGEGGQDGIMDVTTAEVRLTVPIPAVSGEVRSYFVVVARDWRPTPGGSTRFALREAGTGGSVPGDSAAVLKEPGVQSDQIIAVLQVRGGTTSIIMMRDRRLTGSKTYYALEAPPPSYSLPYGSQIFMGREQEPMYVLRNSAGSKFYARRATVGVSDVEVSRGIYSSLPNSPRRGGFKQFGATRQNLADIVIDSPVPYRVSGLVWGLFGADDNPNATITRWDFHVCTAVGNVTLGYETPQGFISNIREYGYLRYRQIPVPVTSQVFAPGASRFYFQAVRQSGNAFGVVGPAGFRFSLAVHPAL